MFYVDPLTAFRRASPAPWLGVISRCGTLLDQFQRNYRQPQLSEAPIHPRLGWTRHSSLCPEQKYHQGRACIKLYSATVKFSLVSTDVKQAFHWGALICAELTSERRAPSWQNVKNHQNIILRGTNLTALLSSDFHLTRVWFSTKTRKTFSYLYKWAGALYRTVILWTFVQKKKSIQNQVRGRNCTLWVSCAQGANARIKCSLKHDSLYVSVTVVQSWSENASCKLCIAPLETRKTSRRVWDR